jgi:transcription termination factor Rho
VVIGPDGEPLAEWEVELLRSGVEVIESEGDAESDAEEDGESDGGEESGPSEGEGGSRRRRRRRNRNRNRGEDGPQGDDRAELPASQPRDRRDRFREREVSDQEPVSTEPVRVSGYLDLHDQGYGFLRVNGYLSSRDDSYVSVKQTRQYGLRKGDYVVGMSRPAGRNEKNPALLEIHSVNGKDPEQMRSRPRFEDLTPLFPDEKLRLENPNDPLNMTARIIDLIAPIGKGQRGMIVSPPKAGKTMIMKTIATSIERNNPEVELIVLLVDERPEEVTDFRRTINGEVVASTFDRPSDEHTHVAELVIEKAKRQVELGKDVVVILDGITRLSRAYNLAAPATGRIMSGGIDAGALYPPKKFFGAARNVEEGGSLTILATALVETNSRMDDAIFEEFKGTGNMELRLDRKLSERRIYPAIDVDASSTRHEELLFDRKQLQLVWKLRRVLSGLAADGNAAPGLELLIDRLKTFRTNDQFLDEIGKAPTM